MKFIRLIPYVHYPMSFKYHVCDLGENEVMSSDSILLEAILKISFTLLKFEFGILTEKSFTALAVADRTQLEDIDGTLHREWSILVGHMCSEKHKRW